MSQTTDSHSAQVEGGASRGMRGASPLGTADDLDLGGALERLLAANRHLRHQLERYDAVLVEGREMVDSGARVSEALVMVPPLDARRAAEAAISALFEARHELRRAVVYATLQEGMTVDAIAATLEVSAHVICALAAETPFRSECPDGQCRDAVRSCRSLGCGTSIR